jgi:hypothetical protein
MSLLVNRKFCKELWPMSYLEDILKFKICEPWETFSDICQKYIALNGSSLQKYVHYISQKFNPEIPKFLIKFSFIPGFDLPFPDWQ